MEWQNYALVSSLLFFSRLYANIWSRTFRVSQLRCSIKHLLSWTPEEPPKEGKKVLFACRFCQRNSEHPFPNRGGGITGQKTPRPPLSKLGGQRSHGEAFSFRMTVLLTAIARSRLNRQAAHNEKRRKSFHSERLPPQLISNPWRCHPMLPPLPISDFSP